MFKSKKQRVSKEDIKKSILQANNRLSNANKLMEAKLESKESELEVMNAEIKLLKSELQDTKDMHVYATNELESQQLAIGKVETDIQEALKRVAKLSEKEALLKESNNILQKNNDSLNDTLSSLEEKKIEMQDIVTNIKALEERELLYKEDFKKTSKELEDIQFELTSYVGEKESLELEHQAFKNELERSRRIAEEGLRDVEIVSEELKHKNGTEMGRLDHAIADRMQELDDLDHQIKDKKYEYSGLDLKFKEAEARIKDAESQSEYIIKQAEEKVASIKSKYSKWKIDTLETIARMKLNKKIDNIDKAGLKDILGE